MLYSFSTSVAPWRLSETKPPQPRRQRSLTRKLRLGATWLLPLAIRSAQGAGPASSGSVARSVKRMAVSPAQVGIA